MKNCDPKKDCLSIPFPKECFDFCIERILRVATPADKVRILGMDKDLAESIFQAYNYGERTIRTFKDLERSLDSNKIKQIKAIFLHLTQEQLNHFTRKMG